MTREEAQATFRALIATIEREMPDFHLGDVPQMIAVNEWKIAMEMLCDHFGDQRNCVVPRALLPDLVAVAEALRLDPGYWNVLRPG